MSTSTFTLLASSIDQNNEDKHKKYDSFAKRILHFIFKLNEKPEL